MMEQKKKVAVLQNGDEDWGKKVVILCVGDEHQYVRTVVDKSNVIKFIHTFE